MLQLSRIGIMALTFASSVVVLRRLGTTAYGTLALAHALFAMLQTFNLVVPGTAAQTLLSMAYSAGNGSEILNLLAYSLKMGLLWSVICLLMLALAGVPFAALLYNGDSFIGRLALWLAFGQLADTFYNLIVMALLSRRDIWPLAVLQMVNQAVLSLCLITAALLSPTPEAQAIGQVLYSFLTMGMALVLYERLRTRGQVVYPPLAAVIVHAWTISPRTYLHIGMANAIDKKLGGLCCELPLQTVGSVLGKDAAGLLKAALNVFTALSGFTSAVYDNLQAVMPRAVQRADYAWIQRNYWRIVKVLTLTLGTLYVPVMLVAPVVFPLLFGKAWNTAGPLVSVLCIYAVIGNLGATITPLYRAFNLYGTMIIIKVLILGISIPVGFWLLGQYGVTGGAWLINLIFVFWAAFTVSLTLRELHRRMQDRSYASTEKSVT